MGWGAIAAAVIGGVASAEASKNASKNSAKQASAMSKAESQYAMERSRYDAQQDYYYQQKEKVERKRGLDEFRKFSTVSEFAPGYVNTNPGPKEVAAPVIPQAVGRIKGPKTKHFGQGLPMTTPYLVDHLTGDGKDNNYIDGDAQ